MMIFIMCVLEDMQAYSSLLKYSEI